MISIKKILKAVVLLNLLLMMGCSTNISSKPNVLFILVDDLGWTDLGVYGSTFHETPHLDALSKEGVRFTNAYAASPVCSPTRAAIMTGKYPTRVNITDWIPGSDPKDRKLLGPVDLHELPLKEVTLAEAMQQNGYKTFFAGKWHLGSEGYYPEDHGFEINMGGHDKGSPPGGYYSPYKNPKLTDGPEGEYLTDRLTNEALQFMEQNTENPFFLMMSFYTVHTPIQASKKHIEKFEAKLAGLGDAANSQTRPEHEGETLLNQVRADYASMVYAMDENVGRLLSKLKQLGLDDNTIVVFTSDNGGLSTLYKNRKPPTSVMPLRAGKGWCYEGGIRIPLIVRAPGIEQAESDVPVISNDLYPTILSLAGLEGMPQQHMDGVDMSALLEGGTSLDRDALFWHFPHYHGSAWKPGAAIRMGDWKLVEFYDDEKTELYNLKDDIGEQNNLAGTNPDKLKELKGRLVEMQQATAALMPVFNKGYSADKE